MALEHAMLVSLRERPAAGADLVRRFDRSIGFFWSATHQQIYRVLGRMEGDGWLTAETHGQRGRPDKKVYAVTPAGEQALADWLAAPAPVDRLRSDLAVRLRGASYGERTAVLGIVREHLADHRTRLAHYQRLADRDFPEPGRLTGRDLDVYLVLRGGIRLEQFWVDWLEEYLHAHETAPDRTTPEHAPEKGSPA